MNARLTILETVYYQPPDGNPTATDLRYGEILESDDAPYVRKIKVGVEWQLLDFAWIARPSVLVISNTEGSFSQTVPTPDERAEVEAKVIEIGTPIAGGSLFAPFAEIPPYGGSIRLMRPVPGRIAIRCLNGPARIILTAIPR